MTPLRLVVFDVDGTLVDSRAHILAAMDAAWAGIGRAVPPRAAVLGIVGLSLPRAMEVLGPDLPAAERAALVAGYRAAFRRLAGEVAALSPLYPGVAEVLAAMRAAPEPLIGLATGKSRSALALVLEAHGLAGAFANVQVADDHPSKPSPAMLLAALAGTGVAPGDAVMVGDSVHDMEMARSAGVPALGVGRGCHRPEALRAAGAVAVLGDIAALAPALETIWGTA